MIHWQRIMVLWFMERKQKYFSLQLYRYHFCLFGSGRNADWERDKGWAKFPTRRREVRLEITKAYFLRRKAKVNKDIFTWSQTLHGKTPVRDASGSNKDVACSQISVFKYSNKFDEQNFQTNKLIPIHVCQKCQLFQKKQATGKPFENSIFFLSS